MHNPMHICSCRERHEREQGKRIKNEGEYTEIIQDHRNRMVGEMRNQAIGEKNIKGLVSHFGTNRSRNKM